MFIFKERIIRAERCCTFFDENNEVDAGCFIEFDALKRKYILNL
jgi:hypothetical protein